MPAASAKRRFVVDVGRLAKKNRLVDAAQLAEATALSRELRRRGVVQRKYDLISPSDHRFRLHEHPVAKGANPKA